MNFSEMVCASGQSKVRPGRYDVGADVCVISGLSGKGEGDRPRGVFHEVHQMGNASPAAELHLAERGAGPCRPQATVVSFRGVAREPGVAMVAGGAGFPGGIAVKAQGLGGDAGAFFQD